MSAHEIYSLLQRSFAQYAELDPPVSALQATIEILERQLGEWLVCYEGDLPIACVRWRVEGHEYTFSHLAVPPEHRRRGVGRRVVELVEKKAVEKNAFVGMVLVRSELADNRCFLESLGYRYWRSENESRSYLIFRRELEVCR